MLTEEERMNNAFKEMLFAEEQMSKKYSKIAQQLTDPEIQQLVKGMEQDTRNHYGSIIEKMKSLKIQ